MRGQFLAAAQMDPAKDHQGDVQAQPDQKYKCNDSHQGTMPNAGVSTADGMVSAAMKTPDRPSLQSLVDSSERNWLKNWSIRLVFTCSSKAIGKALSMLDGGR